MSLNILKKAQSRILFFQKESLFLTFLFLFSFGLNAFFVFSPEKAKLMFRKVSSYKPIENLARVEFSPNEDSPKFRVIKMKKKNKIYVDILFEREDGSFEQSQFLEIKGNQEAYYDYWEKTYTLWAFDFDGDGELELGVPSFDSFLRAHFELLRYDKNTQKFNLEKAKQGPKIKERDPSDS